PEWHAARCGILTASEMDLIITKTLKQASNAKEKTHLYELMAQRITQHVEPQYISDTMLRGHEDEIEARNIYRENIAPVLEVGFITRDFGDVTIGYSPDGLVGPHGLIEVKSRMQKHQAQTIAVHAFNGTAPDDYFLQMQTGMLVSGRKWCDFISYCSGMPMTVIRYNADIEIQTAILNAARAFEKRLTDAMANYKAVVDSELDFRTFPTERRDSVMEIFR
ncbi:MAG: lambda exonuclease family protein, partial [Parasphingorhabdus sp.]|uniref:lambda exonuclease family protein n=1 Tax=Parasphingorhabdus sp. TaxID=2709688 RepID=UPI003296FC5D